MAKQKGNLISGRIGNLVYYVVNGDQRIRLIGPKKIKQTSATKKSAGKFGQASQTARTIRSVLPIDEFNTLEMRNGLNAAMYNFMHDPYNSTQGTYVSVHGIRDFEFNKEAPLRKKLKVNLTTEWDNAGKVRVHIPALSRRTHISSPSGIQSIEFWISVVCCKPGSDTTSLVERKSFIIPYKSGSIPAQVVELPVSVESDMLSIVAAGLRYIIHQSGDHPPIIEKDNKWKTGRILEAMYRKD